MASCEKCWNDSKRNPYKDSVEEYHRLIEERKDNPCTPKEQAGEWWDKDEQRDTRKYLKETK